MLVDICKTELTLGDLSKAARALSDARASAELIADMVQSRGIAPTLRAKLSKLIKTIDLAEKTLSDAYNATVVGAHEPPAPPVETLAAIPITVAAASGR